MEALGRLDGSILLWIQEHVRGDFLTPVFRFITSLGNAGFIWIVFALILLCVKQTRKTGAMCASALIGSLLVNNMLLKNLIARTRPYYMLEGLVTLVPRPHEFSFPSGHTASSFAVAYVLYKNLPKRYGVPALVLAALIGVSRLYVGVHYPSDVLFGALSGIAVGFLAEKFVLRMTARTGQKE